jgi:hypothetical protein
VTGTTRPAPIVSPVTRRLRELTSALVREGVVYPEHVCALVEELIAAIDRLDDAESLLHHVRAAVGPPRPPRKQGVPR